MEPLTQVHDLTTREGTLAYVEGALLPDIRKAFEMRGELAPFGIALITMNNSGKLPRPQPLVVGQFGMPPRVLKRSLRKMATNGAAVGAIFARQASYAVKGSTTGREAEAIVVQLEHKQFGDLCWMAPVVARKLQPFSLATDIAQAVITINPSRFLPARHMH